MFVYTLKLIGILNRPVMNFRERRNDHLEFFQLNALMIINSNRVKT